MEAGLEVRPGLEIPGCELAVDYARSGGPGGQNVNKVATKVVLRWSIRESSALTDRDRAWLLQRLASRLTRTGELVLHSSAHRERGRNLEEARERLAGIVREALKRPTRRRPTRPTAASRKRRLAGKRRRGEVKRGRGRVERNGE